MLIESMDGSIIDLHVEGETKEIGRKMNFYEALKAAYEGKTIKDEQTGHRYHVAGGYFKMIHRTENEELYFYPVAKWMFEHEWTEEK